MTAPALLSGSERDVVGASASALQTVEALAKVLQDPLLIGQHGIELPGRISSVASGLLGLALDLQQRVHEHGVHEDSSGSSVAPASPLAPAASTAAGTADAPEGTGRARQSPLSTPGPYSTLDALEAIAVLNSVVNDPDQVPDSEERRQARNMLALLLARLSPGHSEVRR